ncbi:MAG: hypothetical protein CVT99_15350 [Bacteroidetes bacterium HGW-Bacteroidetes-16]|nr:MAG: hypothetical protein CVT99_15350 [Bacteroidetes bacterium HGW-Bacteroidetes-16]
MRFHLYILICFLFTGNISAQTQKYFSNDTLDQLVRYGTCYQGDHYFLTHTGDYYHQPSHPLLYQTEGYYSALIRLDSLLNLKDSLVFENQNGYYFNPYKLIILNDTLFIAGRAIKEDGSDEQVFLSRYTLDLQFINYSLFGDTSKTEIISDFIVNNNGDFIIPGKFLSQDWQNSYFVLFETNRQGELIRSILDTSWINVEGSQAIQLPQSKEYHFVDVLSVSIYDSALTKNNMLFPEFYQWFFYMHRITYYKNDSYFLGGLMAQVVGKNLNNSNDIQESYNDITYYLIDETATPIDSGYIYLPDTTDFCRGLDYSSNGILCYGGVHNALVDLYHPGFENINKWLVVKNINFNTQTDNWFFRYGGDANYEMYGLYLTPENECIVYATRYDWQHNNRMERDILIMKIDSTGMLVGQNTDIEKMQFCVVYPNPGTNSLSLKTFNLDGTVALFDINGVRVASKPFACPITTINTEQLKPGVYLYMIKDKNHEKLDVGKWIKK